MIETSHHVALPIQRFCPLSTHVSPSRLAMVVSPPLVPEPTSGSVRPKQPIFSQRAIGGSHFCFCSSDPSRYVGPVFIDNGLDPGFHVGPHLLDHRHFVGSQDIDELV